MDMIWHDNEITGPDSSVMEVIQGGGDFVGNDWVAEGTRSMAVVERLIYQTSNKLLVLTPLVTRERRQLPFPVSIFGINVPSLQPKSSFVFNLK